MADGYEMTNCLVCFEEYAEVGHYVPRILPCHHTICEKCILGLLPLGKIRLECPECRIVHAAKNSHKSFPQNKYVLYFIKKQWRDGRATTTKENQKRNVKKEPKEENANCAEVCKEHRREIILFCKEDECNKPICQVCLTRNHLKHTVVDIEEITSQAHLRRCEDLVNKLEKAVKELQNAKHKLLETNEELQELCQESVRRIWQRKEILTNKMDKHFETMVQHTENQAGNVNEAQSRIENIDVQIKLFQELKGNAPKATEEDIKSTLETLKDVVCQETFCSLQSLKYFEFLAQDIREDKFEQICGRLESRSKLLEVKTASALKWTGCVSLFLLLSGEVEGSSAALRVFDFNEQGRGISVEGACDWVETTAG